jgi:TonB family protein
MFRSPIFCAMLFCGVGLASSSLSAQAPSKKTEEAKEKMEESKGFQPPKVLTRAPVGYPEIAHLNRIEGVVRVKFFIDERGSVTNVLVVGTSGSVMLDDMARNPALRDWTFEPATLNGKPVPSTREQEFEFRLDPAEEKALALKRLALPLGTPDPPYPQAARSRKLEGKTTISVRWTQGGLVDQIHLVKSSGAPLLDNTALRFAYENWRIDPRAVTKEPFIKTIEFDLPK